MSNVWLDPSVIELLVGEEGGQTALEVDSDSYGNLMGPFSPWVASWYCSDPSAVSMEDYGTYADFTGITSGFASTAATIYYQTYGWDGLNCYYNGLGQTDAAGEVDVVCAVPTNFHRTNTSGFDAGNGTLHFDYAWESSTGNMSDLSQCTVDEKVTYNASDLPFQSPPFKAGLSPANPTILPSPPVPGPDGVGMDNHATPGPFVTPYTAATITATQIYRYTCPCANSGQPVTFYGPLDIVRSVSQKSNGSWKFVITKDGKSATIDPLP